MLSSWLIYYNYYDHKVDLKELNNMIFSLLTKSTFYYFNGLKLTKWEYYFFLITIGFS